MGASPQDECSIVGITPPGSANVTVTSKSNETSRHGHISSFSRHLAAVSGSHSCSAAAPNRSPWMKLCSLPSESITTTHGTPDRRCRPNLTTSRPLQTRCLRLSVSVRGSSYASASHPELLSPFWCLKCFSASSFESSELMKTISTYKQHKDCTHTHTRRCVCVSCWTRLRLRRNEKGRVQPTSQYGFTFSPCSL